MIRLLIIAPDTMLGSLLDEVFKQEDDFVVAGVLTAGETFAGDPATIDVVALHGDAHGGDLLITIQRLRAQLPDARLVLIHPPSINDIQLNALEAGAVGYVETHQSVSEMVQVIRTVHAHGSAIDAGLVQALVERVARVHHQVALHGHRGQGDAGTLTEREWEVLELIGDRLSNAEIAERLYISVGTVKNHVHKVLVKLNADNREQAGDWYRWQRQYRATAMSGDGGGAQAGGGEPAEAAELLRRGSLLAASRLPALRTMIEERLERFCRQLGWPVGHVFLVDERTGEMAPTGIWYLSDPATFEPFRAASEALRLRQREEVIGQMLFSPEPTWLADVCERPDYQRAQIAREVGIRSGLFLPFFDAELIGAFEFYATEHDQPDPETVAEFIRASRRMGRRLEAGRKE